MGRGLWGVLIVVCLTSVLVWADGGCDCASTGAPACYQSFRSNEIIDFSLTLPIDYFWCHNTTETPVVTRWWVETLDGVIVREDVLPWPTGSWAVFSWDLTTDTGELVGPGYYRILVGTDLTEPISATVLVEPCRGCSMYWACWPCCPALVCVCQPSTRCSIPYGEPYLELRNGGTRSCCGLNVHVYGSVQFGCP